MKIDDSKSSSLNPAGLERTGSTSGIGRSGSSVGRAGWGSSGDEVQLSNLAETVRSLSQDSPEWAARLEQLSRDIESGRYQIDSSAVSAAIVDSALGGF